jgi:hypothetical protein
MNLNFIWTYGPFTYTYYLAVATAMKVHKYDKCVLWSLCTTQSHYLELLKSKGLVYEQGDARGFPALQNVHPILWAATQKDYTEWLLGYTQGGIFMDLDTISLENISDLLTDDVDAVVPLDIEHETDCEHPFNDDIMIIRENSEIAKAFYEECERVLAQSHMKWGDAGPAMVTKIVQKYRDRVNIIPFRVLGGYDGHEFKQIYSGEHTLAPQTRVLHAFAASAGSLFACIDSTFIRNSHSPYALAVKKVLDSLEWDLFSITRWLYQRGQHYAPMYEYLAAAPMRNILEIGTYNGDNAIGMIQTTPVNPKEITYWGFDYFEQFPKDKEQEEAATGYTNAASMSEVAQKIVYATGAEVNLTQGDSRLTVQSTNLPIMDFIYIDGGHSIETIRNDWINVQKCIGPETVIFFDDYFVRRNDIGCKFILDELGEDYEAAIVGRPDHYAVFVARLLLVRRIP